MTQLILWERGTILHTIPNITPQLASWDKSTHPSQIRLRAYRQPIMEELLSLLPDNDPLFLHLDVDVQKPEHLLKHHDLENYLTPLFGTNLLDSSRFALVTARKFVGGGSKLEMGIARPLAHDLLTKGWEHFANTSRGSAQTKQWQETLRSALAATNPLPLNGSPVEVKIAWTYALRPNWVSLWKPTGDCMGPILGEENPLRPFAPNDDRIVDLKFYRILDTTMRNVIQIDMWWRRISSDVNVNDLHLS
jgi:hypothetical protein